MSQIIDRSAVSVTTFHDQSHDQGGDFIISTSTDVSAALRRNEQLRSAGMTKTGDGDHFAASIPIDLLQAWAVERGTSWEVVANDNKMLDRFLAEHTKCRVYEGRIS